MRKITLRKETLTELSAGELGSVVGAASWVCLTDPCITEPVTGLRCMLTDGCA